MIDALRRAAKVRRVTFLRRLAATLHEWSLACVRGAEGARAEPPRYPSKKSRPSWPDVLSRLGDRAFAERLLATGLLGEELPRERGVPAGRRLLVLAPHQDDETIGAGGTLLLAAHGGCAIQPIYYTDGATRLADALPSDVARWRRHEAVSVWQRLAGATPVFWDYPNNAPDLAADAGNRLAAAIDSFRPDTIFLPTFFELPFEHRRLTDVLLRAHAIRPLDPAIEIWGYQITTRVPGNRVVDISPVWKEKYALNRRWKTQNAYVDYAHLAMGRDIANSYYLKGAKHPRRAAAYAEVFVAFAAPAYLELAEMYTAGPAQHAPATATPTSAPPPPDFLVIGMQKSGSYWVTALLDAHPDIRCFPARPGHADGTGEAHLFDILARLDADWPGFRKSMRGKLGGYFAAVVPEQPPATVAERAALIERLRHRFNEYCDERRREARKRLVGEKTTETVHYPDLVDRLYPGIRKICILRDPRDRAVSFFFHQRRKGRLSATEALSDAHARAYVERVRRDYEGLLRMPSPVHVLTYEALSADPHREVERLLAFLGADASAATVDAVVRAGAFAALAGREQGAADPGSHFRQGTVGDWMRHLSPRAARDIAAALDDLTSALERRFGVDLAGYRDVPALAAEDAGGA